MATLQLTPKYFNSYEAAHDILSKKNWFRQDWWQKEAQKGQLDQYITLLSNEDKIDNDKLYDEYNAAYADDDTMLAALYNEYFADRTNTNTEREKYKLNEYNNYILDASGKPVMEKYTASDYDYYKSIIKERNDVNYAKYLRRQEQERKDSMGFFTKALADVGAGALHLVAGMADQVANIVNSIYAVGEGVNALIKGENPLDAMVNANVSDAGGVGVTQEAMEWISDFERRYTHLQDIDGEYNFFGKVVSGVMTSLGQMLPSMAVGNIAGSVLTNAGVAVNTTNNVRKAVSSLVFYQGITAKSVREIYQQFARDNVSVSSAAILANATIKSTLQLGVEIGLGKILGASGLDNLVFGRSVEGITGKSLAGAGTKRILHDFVEEGLEEVLQDTSDFLVDRAFSTVIDENFGELTDLTFQGLMDSFIIGGLASVAGSAFNILTTKRVSTGEAVYDKKGDVKIDKKGDIETKRISKLASWEYGLDMQSFTENLHKLQEYGKNINKTDIEAQHAYNAAFTEMYASYRMLSSIYSSFGADRFKAANDILAKVTQLVKDGKFDTNESKQASYNLAQNLFGLQYEAEDQGEIARRLLAAHITKVADSVSRDQDLGKLNVSEDTKKEIEKLFKNDSNLNTVYLTEDGNNIVSHKDSMFIPINYAKNANAEVIFNTVAEQKLVEGITNGDFKGVVVDKITTLFRDTIGDQSATTEEAIYNLVFNDSFFRIALSTANKDMFSFMSSLLDIEEAVVADNLKDAIYKQKLQTVRQNMKNALYDYLVNQYSADYRSEPLMKLFTDKERAKIAATRWCKNLYARVIDEKTYKKLDANDWTVLDNRINGLPISSTDKETLIKNLHSESVNVRTSAMNRIASLYRGIFTSTYDGKTYMPDTNIPNRTFNSFLQTNGLTIDTLVNTDVDTQLKNSIATMYGEFNAENLLKFRQKLFADYSKNKFTFRYDKNGHLGVYELNTNVQVGFDAYNAQSNILLTPTKLDERTTIDRGTKRNGLVKALLDENIDPATAAYLSIDDVISNPSLLNPQQQANIALKYGEVTIENTFKYLRQYYIDSTKDTTVIALSDGSYAFGTIRSMLSSLKSKDIVINKNGKLNSFIKSEYLYGRLNDTKIQLTNRNICAEYSAIDNTIYVNNDIAKQGSDMLKFALLHEYQHAIQTENQMSIGINSDWINLKTISKTMRNNIINDIRKHKPELFKDVDRHSDTEAQIANDFVYFSSGESTALGIDASQLLNFYPTIVNTTNSGTKIIMPWGTSYNITNSVPFSLMSAAGAFNIEMSAKEKEQYINLASNVINELRKGKDIDNMPTLKAIVDNADYEKYVYNITRLFSVITDSTDSLRISTVIRKYLNKSSDLFNKLTRTATLLNILNLQQEYLNTFDSHGKHLSGQLSINDIESYYDNYSTDVRLTDFSKKVFSRFTELCNNMNYYLGMSYYANEYGIVSQMLYTGEDNIKHTLFNGQYTRDNTILYDENMYKTQNFDYNDISRVLLHEVLHFISAETIDYTDTKIKSLYDKILSENPKLKTESQWYGLVTAYEFAAEYANERFRDYIIKLGYGTEYTDAMNELLSVPIENLLNFKERMENTAAFRRAHFNQQIYEDINYTEGDIQKVKNYYMHYAQYLETINGKQYDTVRDTDNGNLIYSRPHSDSKIALIRAMDDVILIGDGSDKGLKEIYLFKYDTDRKPLSSLGPSDSQSLKVTSNQDTKFVNAIQNDLREFIKENKKISSEELVDKLKVKYNFVPSDIIENIVTDIRGSARKDIEALKTTISPEDNTNFKGQNRYYSEAEDEGVIKNTTDSGKWIEKRPLVDENGKAIRNAQGQIQYRYVYDSKRYVGQKESAGTNLEKFGYTTKYKRTQMSKELQSFIVNAHEGINSKLWDKVKSGKLTTQYVMDYFRDSTDIDDVTFKLINDSYFKNTKIKTFKELQNYIYNKTPKYYAIRAIVKDLGYGEDLAYNANPLLFDRLNEIIEKDASLRKKYDKIVERYYTYKGNSLEISEKNLRRLWMQYFDGSVQSAGYIATVAKAGAINNWLITGEGSSQIAKSLQDKVGEDMEVEDVYEDASVKDSFESLFYSTTREERVEEIMKIAGPKYVQRLLAKGATTAQVSAAFNKKWQQLRDMNETDFTKQYAKIVKGMSEEEINTLFARQLVAESAGLDPNKLNEKQLNNLATVTNNILGKVDRPSSAIVNNINSMIRTIKSNLSSKDLKRFVSQNSDLFTSDLKIKRDLMYEKDNKGVEHYLTPESLSSIENRVKQLSKDVRSQVYKSQRSMDYKKQLDKQIQKLQREKAVLVDQLSKGKNASPVVYNIADEEITIDTNKQIPKALERLLDTEFKKVVKSKTQYIIEGEKPFIQSNLETFLKDNAEYLQSLTQADVNDIVDFYLTSDILPSTNKARQYLAIETYMMAYLVRGNKLGQFVLSEEQSNALSQRMWNIVNSSATNLANWKAVLPLLKPAEVIAQSLAKSSNIEFSTQDIDNLITAVESNDVNRIKAAKHDMYEHGLSMYNGRKKSFLSKVLAFERMMMLSGPGTWARNIASNVMVTGGNLASEQVGKGVSDLLQKLFPNKLRNREGQYQIVGTKVSSEVQTFIKNNFIDNGFMDLVRDGLTKYDTRPSRITGFTSDQNIAKLISQSIQSKIFSDNAFKSEMVNKVQRVILKMLSDDKFVTKAAIRYFGKMLVEDNIDIQHGLTTHVVSTFSEAYKLAAYDYMRKGNFFNKIETQIRNLGEGWYFAYKQLAPFASASWNWFNEALNYTPVGLAKGILNFAKLENTIAKMDRIRQVGEVGPSSRFAQYLAKRNIGKGVIGTIGMAIGMGLAAAGIAGIDENDKYNKYKLFVNLGNQKIAVDISDVFGTQGMLMGIALISTAKGGNIVSAINETLDVMFNDSIFSDVFNSFRGYGTFGDKLTDLAMSIPSMFIPNFVKTLSSVTNKYKVKYSKGILGKFEKLAVDAIPGLAYAFPHQIDPYSGENQVAYKFWFATNLANKLLPFKIYPYNVSEIEKEAISVGVKKSTLKGAYNINGTDISLDSKNIEKLNEYYGKLNKDTLNKLINNKVTYKVWDEKKKSYVELKYNKMTDAQKKTVIERIMNDNSLKAKIYILTSTKNYKYYASESEYKELKALGIKNVYKKTDKLQGFVK